MRLVATVALLGLAGSALAGDDPKTVRTGWNTMTGAPYDRCAYLEVTGPAAAKALILKRAKEQYREPTSEAMAAVDGKVVIRIATMADRRCSTTVPKEVIFVDKKTDKVALRLPLETEAATLQNGFGATWTISDGIGVVPIEEFRSALGDGKFKVLFVRADGTTGEIHSGFGMPPPWTGDHTRRVQ